MDTINVVISVYDRTGEYSKYAGMTIMSTMKKTESSLHFYLLHDETLSENNRNKFEKIVHEYNHSLDFIKIDIPEYALKGAPSKATPAHMFRLKIPDALPEDVYKAIYLDADIIVNLDIKELWNLPMSDNCVLGCWEERMLANNMPLFRKKVLSRYEYINSGVLVLDLKKIRENIDFWEEAMKFFEKYPYPIRKFVDQDAINYILMDKIGHIEKKYNYFTTDLRGKKNAMDDLPVIYHYGDDHIQNPALFFGDRLFMHYICDSPWREWAEKFFITRMLESDRIGKQFMSKVIEKNEENDIALSYEKMCYKDVDGLHSNGFSKRQIGTINTSISSEDEALNNITENLSNQILPSKKMNNIIIDFEWRNVSQKRKVAYWGSLESYNKLGMKKKFVDYIIYEKKQEKSFGKLENRIPMCRSDEIHNFIKKPFIIISYPYRDEAETKLLKIGYIEGRDYYCLSF